MASVVELEQRLLCTLPIIAALGQVYGKILDDIPTVVTRTTADLEGVEYISAILPNIIENLSVVEQDIRNLDE
jgi:hypothetical protein